MSDKPRILLVEDIELNRDLVQQILEDDYQFVVAFDGIEAVRLARQERPDLILMDLSLPGIDGWEATRRIKQDEALARIPVIALTAHAMAGDRQKALAAGCDDVLTKPLDDELLVERVRHWLAKVGVAEAKPSAPAKPAPEAPPGDVLIIDDIGDNRDQLAQELGAEGLRVRVAERGEEGLARAVLEPPDVVVLDLAMPEMDGVEVCRRLRQEPATRDVMIIFCSAYAGPGNVSRALDAGGNDFVTRPYSAEELVARVRAALRMKRAQEALKKHISDLARSAAQTARDPLAQVWDRSHLFERIEEEGRRAAQHRGRALASILIAVDDVDELRRRHEQRVLDGLVRALAALVLDRVSSPEATVSRYGELEFLVLLPNVPLGEAQALAEGLRDAVREQTFRVEGAALSVTVSSGVAYFDAQATQAAARVVRAADVALYLARRGGTSQVRVLDQ